jgi:hypothetical protein
VRNLNVTQFYLWIRFVILGSGPDWCLLGPSTGIKGHALKFIITNFSAIISIFRIVTRRLIRWCSFLRFTQLTCQDVSVTLSALAASQYGIRDVKVNRPGLIWCTVSVLALRNPGESRKTQDSNNIAEIRTAHLPCTSRKCCRFSHRY